MFLLQWAARSILYFTGWRLVSKEEKERVFSKAKVVYIYPHTSTWHFIIGVLYMFAQPDLSRNGYFVMKPQPFDKWYGGILRKGRFIPATKRQDAGEGFVTTTANLLSTFDKAHLFISPEGTRVANKWRSGFYYIAKGMNAKIGIVGLDYELQELSFKNTFDPQDYSSYEELKEVLMKEMENIVPLYPSSSETSVRKYMRTKLINTQKLISRVAYMILLLAFIYNFLL